MYVLNNNIDVLEEMSRKIVCYDITNVPLIHIGWMSLSVTFYKFNFNSKPEMQSRTASLT